MSTPILATKLYIPPPRPKVIARPRLIARLNEGLQRKLTLISAPAGFGKTTLVSEWIQTFRQGESTSSALLVSPSPPPAVAWLSLDEGDSDLVRFLSYLAAALQTIAPQIGGGVLSALRSSQPPRDPGGREALLTELLNEITAATDKPPHPAGSGYFAPKGYPAQYKSGQSLILVLDDYHVIDAAPNGGCLLGAPLGAVDQALIFLLEHLPPQMHLVITTREDPQLPLARYRVRGQLTELRAADLRFTATEAAEFLNQVMGLGLAAADIAALEERTEGWIAGLQLAALSMQDHQDVPGFIRAFAGDHRYIVDYLVEEVLQRQPAPVRSFLLQTAILDRLHGPLCDAVTGQQGGNARLEALERGNFFVVPLDNKRHWYRYHHLFAEVLAAHLRAEQPDQVSTLHQRASAWYEQHGAAADAIRHALAGGDFERAADLVELAVPATRRSREEAMLLGWLKALPDEVIYNRPVLSIHYAGTLLQSGELQGVEKRLRDAERWLDTALDTGSDIGEPSEAEIYPEPFAPERHPPQAKLRPKMVVVDREEFRRLPGWIAIYHAGQALMRGDMPATLTYAQRALDLVPEDHHPMRGAAAAILGLAYWTSGDLEAAHQMYADGMAHLQMAGNISDTIGGVIALADIRIAQGRLHEAMRIYAQALQLATAHGDPVLRGTADMYVGMSELRREHNELDAARQHLLRSKEQGEHTGFPQNPYRWRVAMARIKEAEGDLDSALDLLQEAERLYVSDFFPNVRPISALRTRVWIAQGRLGEALGWVRAQGLSVHDDLSYLREFEHITLARVLLAQVQHDPADHTLLEVMGLLARLLQAAEAGGRMGSGIEILILQALAYQMQDDTHAALMPLERALRLAEPEGYVRIFVDEGPPMAALLNEAAHHDIVPHYVRQLRAAFGQAEAHPPITPNLRAPGANFIEPLSERELEVLRLLGTELDGPEIARRLMISLNTMRTHTKNIYSKLGVNNRRAAVRHAQELDLY